MATVQELERAFLNAHNAGDAQAAQALADALRQAMAAQPAAPEAPKKEPETGFMAGLKSGYERLKGDIGAIGAAAGVQGAEEYAAKQREKAGEIYRQPEFTEAPVSYLTGLLGQSIPYMAAPVAAAAAAPEAIGALGAAGLAGLASATQFTGSNISRQLEEGVSAKDANVLKAVAASVPQAALDVVSFRMIPGIQKIFGSVGRELTEQEAAAIAKDGIIGTMTNAVKSYGPSVLKTAGVEGTTEAGQQFFERLQAGLSITDEEARKEYLDNFVGGALLGGTLAVPGRAVEKAQARSRLAREQQVETLPRAEEAPVTAEAPAARPAERPAELPPEPTAAAPEAPVAKLAPAEIAPTVSDEELLRARAEAPPVPEAEFVSGEPQPEAPEVVAKKAQMAEDEKALVAERNRLEKGEKGKSLWSAIRGNLTESDLAELGDKSFSSLRAPKGEPGKSISELAANGSLNAWLPPELQIIKGQEADLVRMEGEELTRAKAADEYIKEQLRQRNYLTWETNNRLSEIGTSLADIESSYREFADEEFANRLFQEAFDEQRAIDQETAGVAPEGEAGGIEPPARVYETIPEEPVEEEYFPDQEELRGRLAQKQAAGRQVIPELADIGVTPEIVELYRKYDEASNRPDVMSMEGRPSDKANLTRTFNKLYAKLETLDKPNSVLQKLASLSTTGVDNLYVKEKPSSVAERERFVINKDPEHERIEKELTGKSMLQVAQWAVDNAPNQFAKAIAQKVSNRLNGMAKRGIKMEFDIASGQQRPVKMYNARGLVEFDFGRPGEGKQPAFKMTINGAAVMDNQGGYPPGARYITVLHELLHVATVGQINVLKGSDPLVKDLRDLFNKVVTHFNTEVRAGRLTPIMEKMYAQEINALSSPDELLAWGIADKEMQEFLSEIKVGDQTIMDKLVELIRKILNVTKPYLTALDQLVKTTESILDEDVDVVGDKIIAKQYSFGVKPGVGEAVQGSLFEQAGKPSRVEKAKEKVKAAIQPRKLEKSQFKGVSDEYYEALKPIFAPEKKTVIDKIDGMRDDFWKKLAQGIADQYRTIKDYSEEAYMKARMSKTIDGALEGILFNGEVKLTDGALDIAKDTKGLLKALEPVGNEVDRYQIWVALNRDAELVSRKKAPSVNPKLVERRDELSNGEIGKKSRLEVYQQVQKDMNKLNRSVLRIAVRQGIIDKQAYKIYARDINYIPFYKVMDENGDVQSAATKSGLVSQYFSKALKGGEKPFGDLMENTLRNWSHILSASMKNEAANATVRSALEMGAAYPNLKVGFMWRDGKVYSAKSGQLVNGGKLKPEFTTSGKGMVKTMIDGKPAYFEVIDPLLLESIMSIGYMGPKSKFLDLARDFKNMLQFGVTLSPAFKIRNLFRDSISAMAVSDLKKNPFANVAQGWAASDKNNPAHISALAGGAIFNFGSAYEGDQAKMIKRLLDSGVSGDTILDNEKKIEKGLKQAWRAYQDWGNKSEAANRMALYKQLRERVNPKTKENFTHLEASFYARDMLDFSMQGSWPAFRLVTQVVPFLNARVQGLYKLGRDGVVPTSRVIYNTATGKPIDATDAQKAQQFSAVMGAVTLASLMLYMAFKDDDEFKKREQWDRDNFWWFKLPGMDDAFRVPKPFEIGAIGTMAERVAEQIFDQGAEGKIFEQSMKRMLTDTFAINPIPQMIKPLVDLYANKDSFTGAPIETAGMERLSKEQRIAEKTSPLAIALSKVSNVFLPESTEISPVQADYAIKAYLGWLGGTISWSSHYAVQPFSKSAYPDNDWKETFSMGFIKSLPATQSKYVTAFYENNKEISQAYADMRHFAQLGEADKVQEILKEKGDKIAMAKFYDNASKDMAKVRQAIQAIRNDENMSGAQKKEEIDRLKILIGEIARQMEEARLAVKKSYATAQ